MKPFIKWAGGKSRFADIIVETLGKNCRDYYEPFLGSGAVLLKMQPEKAFCSDINAELINLFQVVKSSPYELVNDLRLNFLPYNSQEFFYNVRSWDRDNNYLSNYSPIKRAARFFYLNKTGYNGMWRVNRNGYYNIPYGRNSTRDIVQEDLILSAHNYFSSKDISFSVLDYITAVKDAQEGDVVYFDPPYDTDEGQSTFLEYNQTVFGRKEQVQLKLLCDDLIKKGVHVGISNSGTSFIKELYNDYNLIQFDVMRTIGGTKASRRQFSEVFIYKK